MNMTRLYAMSAIALMIGLGTVTPAEAKGGHGRDCAHCITMQKWKGMSAEEKKAFFAERKARWNEMSKEEKLDMIEKHRLEKREKMDEHWSNMDDEEKIRFVEKKMQKGGHGHGRKHDKHGAGDAAAE